MIREFNSLLRSLTKLRLRPPWAWEFVNRPHDDLLAGPGFVANQDGGGRGCYRVDSSED
jgi:hypothetical protein